MGWSFRPRDLSPCGQPDARYPGDTLREFGPDVHGQPGRNAGTNDFDFHTLCKHAFCESAGIHGNMRLRHKFGNSRRRETEFVRAEDLMDWDQQPPTLAWFKCRGDGAEINLVASRRGLKDANARIATTQWPADLFLIGIHCLNGVPP